MSIYNPNFESRQLPKAGLLGLIAEATASEPVTQRALADRTGLDCRTIRGFVQKMRRAGWRICSSCSGQNGGYWMAGSDAEFDMFRTQYKKSGISRFKTLADLQKNSRTSQPSLFGGEFERD